MACSGSLAAPWQFAALFCVESILIGLDDSGGVANPSLQDLDAEFVNAGVAAGVGMIVYNLTKGTSGPITAVTQTTLAATGVTWDDGDQYRVVAIDSFQRSSIEHNLNMASSDVHAVVASVGACDCSKAAWATDFLAKLAIIDAAVLYNCTCGTPNLDADTKRMWLDWLTDQFTGIRTGLIELCAGHTGAGYPAVGVVEQGLTRFNRARIIANRTLRGS